MALAWLIDPQHQFMTKSGTINVGGTIRVFEAVTDDPVLTFKDFTGTENELSVVLDSNGRANVIADPSKAYRVEVYDRYGTLMWTAGPVWCLDASGDGATGTEVISSDGSISVVKTVTGGMTQFDISNRVDDSTDLLEWIASSGDSEYHDGAFHLVYNAGTMEMGERGVRLGAKRYYHVTAEVTVGKDVVHPVYDNIDFVLYFRDGEGDLAEVAKFARVGDYSMGLSQCWTVACDCMPETDVELVLRVEGKDLEEAGGFTVTRFDVHRVFSGAPALPGGVQEKLVAGENITIEGNVISANANMQEQADWAQSDSGAVDFIKNKPDLSVYATQGEVTSGLASKQDTLIAGTNITIEGNAISATGGGGGGGGTTYTAGEGISIQNDEISVDTDVIQEKLTAGSNITISGNTISAAATQQVNADWDANSGVAQILNRPNLAAVATSGSYNDLSDKPSIPTFTSGQQAAIDSGINSTKVSTYDTHVADTTIHVTSTDKTNWNAKEDASNKKQSIDDSSTTDYPSSKAVADFVNSSVATATARFLGSFTLTDLGLTYGATNAQIATALDNHVWPGGTTPTNNDYVYVEIQNPQTTSIDDEVRRFKFNGTVWAYEYTLNNSSFTAAEKAAIDSGITSSLVTIYSGHVADSTIHVTSTDKSTWNAKQDAISDLATIRSGASAGATAVQPGDLATVATSGSYNDLLNKPSIPAAQVNADWDATSGIAEILNKPTETMLVAGTNITITESGSTLTISATGGGSGTQVNADWDATSGVAEILNKPNLATVATSGSYSDLSNKPTIPSVDQTYNSSSTNAQSGTAVAGAIANVRQVPTTQSTDNGKVLGVTDANGTLGWVAQNTGTTYTAGNMISLANDSVAVSTTAGITDIQQVAALPANPVSTVLYLIPAT